VTGHGFCKRLPAPLAFRNVRVRLKLGCLYQEFHAPEPSVQKCCCVEPLSTLHLSLLMCRSSLCMQFCLQTSKEAMGTLTACTQIVATPWIAYRRWLGNLFTAGQGNNRGENGMVDKLYGLSTPQEVCVRGHC
jgi:hypothetical protein